MDEEGNSWVFDSLIGFLRGPVWNIPILTFIEHKSLVFEPDCEAHEEYKKVHEDYKNLVDFMLGSYMEDLGITPEQFEEACGKATRNIRSQFQQSLFEQVWAAEDYEIFRRMMIQKNIELQLQALELIQQRHGTLPESMTFSSDLSQHEEKVMEEVIKRTLEENQKLMEQMDQETKEIEESIATEEEKHRLETEHQREKDLLDKAMKLSLQDVPINSEEFSKASDSYRENANLPIDPEEIAKRQEHLRRQRDKLLAMKKQEREKQLAQMENNGPQRPKSARAAKTALENPEATTDIDPKTLAARRALAARLKAEVIGQM